MLKSMVDKTRTNKYDKVPIFIGDIIPIKNIYEDGLFEHNNNLYSICIKFDDINYFGLSKDDKMNIFMNYCTMLNSFDTVAQTKISIINKKIELRNLKKNILISKKYDGLDLYRDDYNNMIIKKSNR